MTKIRALVLTQHFIKPNRTIFQHGPSGRRDDAADGLLGLTSVIQSFSARLNLINPELA